MEYKTTKDAVKDLIMKNKELSVKDICCFLKKNFKMHHAFYLFAILELFYILWINSFGDFSDAANMVSRLGVANLLLIPVFFAKVLSNQNDIKNTKK